MAAAWDDSSDQWLGLHPAPLDPDASGVLEDDVEAVLADVHAEVAQVEATAEREALDVLSAVAAAEAATGGMGVLDTPTGGTGIAERLPEVGEASDAAPAEEPEEDAHEAAPAASDAPHTPAHAALTPAEMYAPPTHRSGSRIATPVWLALLVAVALVGGYVGHTMAEGPVSFGSLNGKVSITEAQLDHAVATYVLDDERQEVTAREALAQQGSLDAARGEDGSYAMPSVESVVAAARTAVLMRDVTARGIEVSDDELVAYAKDTFGTEDLASLGAAYQMDDQTLRERLRESAALAKLRAQVVSDPGTEPQPPAAPAADKAAEPTADYAAYIIALAGDEWDASQNHWASDEGPYATALHDYDVSNEAATYEAANTAYNLAYQQHGENEARASEQWSAYVNDLLCKAEIAVCTLGS